MFNLAKRICAVAMATLVTMALAVSAGASYIGKTSTDGKMVGAAAADGACTVTVDIVTGDGNDKVIYFDLAGDATTNEFWNNGSAYVELDVTLETDSSTVSAIMPGCTTDWGWVSPATWGNSLVYGKTVTIREDFMTYYNNGFNSKKPLQLRLQIISTSAEKETVQISVSGMRFVGVDAPAVEVTTTAAPATTTTVPQVADEPVEETPVDSEQVDDAQDTPADPVEETPAATTSSAQTTTAGNAAVEENDTASTTAANTTAATTTTRAAANISSDETSVVGMIITVVSIAVVIIVVAVVGYIIYKKKKYY